MSRNNDTTSAADLTLAIAESVAAGAVLAVRGAAGAGKRLGRKLLGRKNPS